MEIDESASNVVVYDMVRGRLFVTNCGEQFSPVSFGQPTLKAGYIEKVPTDNVQGVVCYGKLTGEIDEPAPDVVVYGMVSRCCPVSLDQLADGDGVSPATAGYMERSMHLSPMNKVSTDNVATLSATAARGGD